MNDKKSLLKSISPMFDLSDYDRNQLLASYTPPSVNNFALEEYSADEVLDDISNDSKLYNYDNIGCDQCFNLIEDYFNIYSLEPLRQEYNSKIFCSSDCLKKYINLHNDIDEHYDIYSHTRCSAFYKCDELDNLRLSCEHSENLSYNEIFTVGTYNMCESAQAGIILASHKSYKVIEEFSTSTNRQLSKFDKVIEDMSKESNKQFKINLWMTILVITLTIVNLAVAIAPLLSTN